MLMKRFNEDEEGFFDDDDEEGIFEAEGEFYIPSDTLSSIHDLEMFEMELDRKIMKQAIAVVSANFWWKFKSIEKKHKAIHETYAFLKKIYLEDQKEEEGEGEPNADV